MVAKPMSPEVVHRHAETGTDASVTGKSAIPAEPPSGLAPWIRPRLHTVEEAAEVLRLSERQLRRLIAGGRLRSCRIGRAVRVLPEAIAELVARGTK